MTILSIEELRFPWQTLDPFLFCVHHDDDYPVGNGALGVSESLLGGREIGMDFSGNEGWSMYHGNSVPGFPRHPHRGFETVTVARRGLIDHSDSLGATARYGDGDVQWMTAGAGIVHSEMFPLVRVDEKNPTELFQIWINLPAKSKMVEPHFSMMWSSAIPRHRFIDGGGQTTIVTTIAKTLEEMAAPSPPPHSWASEPEADVAIWTIAMEPEAQWTLPPASPGSHRVIYFFEGVSASIAGRSVESRVAVEVAPDVATQIVNGGRPSEFLVLGGRPIDEPVVSHGPFVMNSRAEILATFADFQKTGFGGWPWESDDPTHGKGLGRFAIHADGGREDAPE